MEAGEEGKQEGKAGGRREEKNEIELDIKSSYFILTALLCSGIERMPSELIRSLLGVPQTLFPEPSISPHCHG